MIAHQSFPFMRVRILTRKEFSAAAETASRRELSILSQKYLTRSAAPRMIAHQSFPFMRVRILTRKEFSAAAETASRRELSILSQKYLTRSAQFILKPQKSCKKYKHLNHVKRTQRHDQVVDKTKDSDDHNQSSKKCFLPV